MADFVNLLEDEVKKPQSKELVVLQPKAKAPKKPKGLGCENCELNDKHTKKFITKVRGRKFMVIGSYPTDEDEEEGKLFKSTAYKFLWKELKKVGISRTDCDVQAALRCNPGYNAYIADKKYKHPLRCCSLHTNNALEQSKAKVYLVLGIEAAKQAFGKEYRTGTQIFWSDKLNAKVYCLPQPSYYLNSRTTNKSLKDFRKTLGLIADDLNRKSLSPYQYLYDQDYKGILTYQDAKKESRIIRKAVKEYLHTHKKPLRLAVDEESGPIGKQVETICIGTCIRPGRSRIFVLHPKFVTPKNRRKIRGVLKDLLEDGSIEKVFHHGSHDVPTFAENLDIFVQGFTIDTEYSTYLYNPDLRSYGLNKLGVKLFPQFGDYKTITLPESLPKDLDEKYPRLAKATLLQRHEFVRARGLFNYAQLPLEKLIRYNGADCDITKRLELKTVPKISLQLQSVYRDCGFVLDKMAPNGPVFDFKQYGKLTILIPTRIKAIKKQLIKLSRRKDFNPNATAQVATLLYDTLKLKPRNLSDKEKRAKKNPRTTDKNTLEVLGRRHKAPKLVAEYRKLAKMDSTYLKSYEYCANNNDGRLRTKWWLTGTRTGRLSSGGGKGEVDLTTSVVNLQNVHGDQQLQNMLVPDKHWRKLYVALKEAVGHIIDEFTMHRYFTLSQNKDKKEEYNKLHEKIFNKLSTSLKFKREIEKIIKKHGNVKIVLGFDQGQVEVRVMAQASGDKNLIRDCMSGDIHSMVGHRMTGWPVEKIKKDKKTRTLTKNIHFGILFGLSPNGLMAFLLIKDPDTDITEAKALELYENYFESYPGVRRFIEKMRRFVEDHGYVESMFGFKRPLGKQDVYSESDDGESGGAYWGNQAINTPIQGSAHQLMLMAMTLLKNKESEYYKALKTPGMEVHDAIYWWTRLKDILKAKKAAKKLLEKEPLNIVKKLYPHIKWKIPLEVEGKAGLRMGDTVEIEGQEIHQILANMFLESYKAERNINKQLKDLKKAA